MTDQPTEHLKKGAVRWACACAERVLSIFAASAPADLRPLNAVAAGRAWASGLGTVGEARNAAFAAHAAAREVDDPAARAAARAAGHAAATAHVITHARYAASYAAAAVGALTGDPGAEEQECVWQRASFPAELRGSVEPPPAP